MQNTQKLSKEHTELALLKKELALLKWEEKDRELHPFKYFDLYTWQDDFIYQKDHIKKHGVYPHRMYLTCANQVGKMTLCVEDVPTPKGLVKHGDLKVGDYVFGQDGKPTQVTGVYPHENIDCYEVIFSDGSRVKVGDEHLWITKGEKERFRPFNRPGKPNKNYGQWKVKTTKQIIEDGKYSPETKPRLRHVIPITSPVEYEEKDLFDPYLLGCLIGDGCFSNSITLTNKDEYIIDYVDSRYEITRTDDKTILVKGMIPIIKKLGLYKHRSWEKFIPREYLLGSVEQRMLLLAGLMDTDGSCDNKGAMEYSTASETLADDIVELITSLGGKVIKKERDTWFTYKGERREGRKSYRLHIYMTQNPFNLPRKADNFRVQDRYKHERVIVKINYIGKHNAKCISVDNEDSSYLVTRSHIVTHNTFALQLLAHMLCTDKEFREKRWGNNKPKVIWYVLPTQEHINDFFHEKWEPDILARGEAKKEGPYSWKVVKKGADIKGIKFLDTGCTLNFITLKAQSSSHQGRSVGAMLFDEEPDERKLSELETRTASFNDPETGLSNAILAFAFTPTSAQDYFKKIFQFQDEKFLSGIPEDLRKKFFLDKETNTYRTCSTREEKNETFKRDEQVWKRRVSMFEATKFVSGKSGKYTEARIRQFIKDQPSRRDVLVRAFAQFEKEDTGGLIYKYFNRDIHTKYVPRNILNTFKGKGLLTAGLDYGSGSNHPGGVAITWISDDRQVVKVIKMWRGEMGKVTTAGDIVKKYIEMSRGLEIEFPFYDHSCADLKTIYNRMTGKALIPAAKDKEGYGFVDNLFANNMLQLLGHDDEPYIDWACTEFENISFSVNKKDRTDELSDCVRYSLYGVAHLFDLQNLVPKDAKELIKEVVEASKTPEDYGVRSWSNVKEDKEQDNWIDHEMDEWEGYFND